MKRIIHYIDFLDGNGYQEVTPPEEWKGLEIEWNFAQNERRLNTSAFTWTGNVAVSINNRLSVGSIFEALPYKAVYECDNTSFNIVEAGIEMSSEDAEWFCDIVKAPIKETGKIDYFTDRAQSFRFEFLAKGLTIGQSGFINTTDYLDIWYVIGKYPELTEIGIALMAVFVLTKETYETSKRILDISGAVAGGATGVAEAAIQLAALLIYLVSVVAALITMMNQLIDVIFPFVYYHRGMYERVLWQKACDYLGLGFSSDFHVITNIHYNDYIMPPVRPSVNGSYNGIKVGQPSTETGFYDGTFFDFIQGQIEKYNGEYKIINGVLTFKRKNSFASLSSFNIPQNEYDSTKKNAHEIPSNYYISYLYDSVDLQDYNAPLGRNVQIVTEVSGVVNKKNITLTGLTERRIPYSLPNVKSGSTALEIQMAFMFNAFALLANSVAAVISPGSPTIPTIPTGQNLNVLRLDTHFTSVHKSGVYLGSGKTNPNSYQSIGARQLFYQSHYSEIGKPVVAGNGNQWVRYGLNGDYKMHLCCEDAVALASNNYAKYNGNDARFMEIKWKPYEDSAIVSFEENTVYDQFLTATLIETNQPKVIL